MDDLEELLGGAGEPTPPAGSTPKEPTQEEIQKNNEIEAKKSQLANLDKAIGEAQGKLRDLRKAKKNPTEDDDTPKIDMEDPSAKAWDKHIRENVAPLKTESDKERDEVRGSALREFLKDKPALAGNPEKLAELMGNYQSLSSGKITEKVGDVVVEYLKKAYAATFPEQLLNAARNKRIEQAESDILFSDIAVSRGATAYQNPKEDTPRLSEEDRDILRRWGYSPSEWVEDKKKYK